MVHRSAIVLAGGYSTRINEDKGLVKLNNIPLVNHVINRVDEIVDETIIVVASESQKFKYRKQIKSEFKIVKDFSNKKSPLMGALSGFLKTKRDFAFVTGCDYPFLVPDLIELLFLRAEERDGATLQWPNGWIEPLNAVYKVKPSIKIGKKLYHKGDYRLRYILRCLNSVRYIPINDIKKVDPDLLSLFDIDTTEDLIKAEKTLEGLKDR